MNAIDKAREKGVPIIWGKTDYRVPCPECSPKRIKKNDPCLHVTIGAGRVDWYCHHCEKFKGTTEDGDDRTEYRGKGRCGSGTPKREQRSRGPRWY